MLGSVLILVALMGLATCTIFLLLVLLGARRFRRQGSTASPGPLPPVSVLKPVHGMEPRLEQNLESFFLQDYPEFEIIFGARHHDDPALQVVERLRQRYPRVPVRVVLAGEPEHPNAKVCALEKMLAAGGHPYLVISDSDVRVTPRYLREVVEPLLDERVGLVTCLYRGVPAGGLWSRLEALGMSVEMASGVLVANLMEGMRFALGPTMALRKERLAEVGGFEALADYCADDYVLGHRIHAAGYQVVLSHHVIDHFSLNRSLAGSLSHQVRWMKSTRYSRPRGHLGTGLTFAMPFGILGLLAGLAAGEPWLGLALLGAALANRMLQALAVGWGVVRDPEAARFFWLYPARDFLGFVLWCYSFADSSIEWRGERYQLQAEGRMVPASALPVAGSQEHSPA
ncbi:MAG TPA: bacteriohopanetetrol glucosamine biosynthesis glycosyltransferase HpnI [Terriglobales bacterium]|nr:bacteriohopanetetrol glucosamine biosynthesis glycosyltransferase HpnI [Terriglobales bacterium]